MPLYVMALEQLWGINVEAACYDSPRESGRRRFFRTEQGAVKRFRPIDGVDLGKDVVKPVSANEHEDTLHAARQAVIRAAEGIAAGRILPKPGNYCKWCDYGDCCRTGLDNVHDGEAFDLATEDE